MSEPTEISNDAQPNPEALPIDFAAVQAHYDLSDEFFTLFLDPSMTYTCALFNKPDATLEEAQLAKIDHTLAKCELQPGGRLLDIGSGWGATAMRARQKYDISVIGLTLSENQFKYSKRLAAEKKLDRIDFRLEGWETFSEPVDRIVSIGAFEHFGAAKYHAFFQRCHQLLPADGLLVLHTITLNKPSKTFAFLRFSHFMSNKIFPGGFVPPPEWVIKSARAANLDLLHVESLRPHYAQTLDAWAENLRNNREAAIACTDNHTYDTYMRYLTSCASYFKS